jgi:hypothetical protein
MRVVGIQPLVGDHLEWQLTVPPEREEQGASILFNLRLVDNPMRALQSVARFNELTWLSPARDFNEWVLNLDELQKRFPDYFPMSWCRGRVHVYPTYPTRDMVGTPRTGIEFRFDSSTVKI